MAPIQQADLRYITRDAVALLLGRSPSDSRLVSGDIPQESAVRHRAMRVHPSNLRPRC